MSKQEFNKDVYYDLAEYGSRHRTKEAQENDKSITIDDVNSMATVRFCAVRFCAVPVLRFRFCGSDGSLFVYYASVTS